jgi:hypothetical protein
VVTLTHRPSLHPGVFWYSFLEAESCPGHMVPSVATEKIPSDSTGDRFRDLQTSSAVRRSKYRRNYTKKHGRNKNQQQNLNKLYNCM